MQQAALSTGRDYSKKTNNANNATHCAKLGRKKNEEAGYIISPLFEKKWQLSTKKRRIF